MARNDPRIVRVDGRNRRPWALASKDRLIEAATQEIAEVGFERAKLSDIAKRADMTAGSVYTWFENKEDLFSAALEDALTHQISSNASALEGTDVGEHDFLFQVAALVLRNHEDAGPTDAQMLLIESYYAAWRNPKARKQLLKNISSHIEMYTTIVKNGQKTGHVSPDIDPEALALIMVAIPTGLSLISLAGGPRVNNKSWTNIVTYLFGRLR